MHNKYALNTFEAWLTNTYFKLVFYELENYDLS